MNWNTLRDVVEIAEQKSFSKAARKLYLAQPSLSQSIRALEQELGTPLFDRTRSPLRLTYAGELFAKWAKESLRSQEQTVRRIADVAEGVRTRLVVGVSFSRSAYLFPGVMAQFRRERPNCSVILVERPTSLLSQEDNLDLLIDVPHDESLLDTSVLLAEERLLLAVPPNLAGSVRPSGGDFPSVSLADFSDQPFVLLSEDQMLRQICFSLCAQEGFVPQIALECRSLQTAHAMAEAGVGVTLVPELFVRHAVRDRTMCYCVMQGHPAVRKLAVTYRSDRYLSEDARILIGLLQKLLR